MVLGRCSQGSPSSCIGAVPLRQIYGKKQVNQTSISNDKDTSSLRYLFIFFKVNGFKFRVVDLVQNSKAENVKHMHMLTHIHTDTHT